MGRDDNRGIRALAGVLLVTAAGGISWPAEAARWESAPSTPAAIIRPIAPSAAPTETPHPVAAMRESVNKPVNEPVKMPVAAPRPGPDAPAALSVAPSEPAEEQPGSSESPAERAMPPETEPAAEPAATPAIDRPTLANARWLGFTPASYGGEDGASGPGLGGAWIAGPFGGEGQIGWVTDISTGRTVQASFRWRQAEPGNPVAELSREAAAALGLAPGEVANLALYLPR